MRLSPTYNLAFCFPEIAAEWDYAANGDLRPENVGPGSRKKVWWKCSKDPTHKWRTTVCNRTGNGRGCPCCSGKLASPTYNLAFCFPEIAAEWDYEVNGTLRPEDVTPLSNKKPGWRCLKDPVHKWIAIVKNRAGVDKTGCPTCARAQQRSRAEIEIYEHVLRIYPDAIPSDHGVLGFYELDMYVPSLAKAVEYDGTYWHSKPKQIARDRRKDAMCVKRGVQLLRITEVDYESNRPATLQKIEQFLRNDSSNG